MKILPVVILAVCLLSGCEGPLGPMGPRGQKGLKGDQGETGPAGENYEQEGSITFSDLHYDRNYYDKYPGELRVWGNFENSGTTVLDNIKIHVKAYNELDGLIIAYYIIPDQSVLAPGQKSSFEAYFNCPQKPKRVTFGYSGNVPIYVPAWKRTSAAGGF
ncbi:hypothetical protein ES703_57921 [subsurface metagenome]